MSDTTGFNSRIGFGGFLMDNIKSIPRSFAEEFLMAGTEKEQRAASYYAEGNKRLWSSWIRDWTVAEGLAVPQGPNFPAAWKGNGRQLALFAFGIETPGGGSVMICPICGVVELTGRQQFCPACYKKRLHDQKMAWKRRNPESAKVYKQKRARIYKLEYDPCSTSGSSMFYGAVLLETINLGHYPVGTIFSSEGKRFVVTDKNRLQEVK